MDSGDVINIVKISPYFFIVNRKCMNVIKLGYNCCQQKKCVITHEFNFIWNC